MSFTNTTVKQSYQGDGSTTTFAIPFEVITSFATEGVVYLRNTNSTPATEELKVITTHYTVSGSNIVFVTAPTATQIVVIYREVAKTQTLDLVTSGAFLPESHEEALDRIVGMIQDLSEKVERAPILQVTEQLSGQLILPYPSANKVLAWNSAGTALENVTASEVISNIVERVDFNFTIGSAAQVTAGTATHSTWAGAITAASAGDSIKVLEGTWTETVTVSKQLHIEGSGYGSNLTGSITFDSSSDRSSLDNIRMSDNLTLNSGADLISINNVWFAASKSFIDNGTGNILSGFQE